MEDLLECFMLEAKEAHMMYEVEHGPDDSWPRWYAQFLLHRLNEEGYGVQHIIIPHHDHVIEALAGPMGKVEIGEDCHYVA